MWPAVRRSSSRRSIPAGVPVTISAPPPRWVSGRSNVFPSHAKTSPGCQRLPQPAQRRVVAREQRIGGRERSVRDADVHRRQRQDGVLEAVAGQDDHRPIRRQVAIEQRLRNRARAPQGLAVGEVLPRAVGTATGEKRAIRRVLRPMFEAVGDAGRRTARAGRDIERRWCRRRASSSTVGSEMTSGMAGPRRVHGRSW